ncbi:MAG: GNAT family N-acetyltransferase [Polyangiaceae bacterium]
MNRYEAYLAPPEEQQSVANLWREGMSDSRIQAVIEKRLAWFYATNPVGPAKTWFVKDTQADELIGCASVYPRRVRVGDRTVTAGVMSDFLVSKKHRIAGPALQLQRTLAEQSADAGFEFIYGYPNNLAWPIFKRIGYEAVAQSVMWVKPLRTGYKLGELTDSRLEPYVGPRLREKLVPPAARIGSLIGDRVLQANDLRLAAGKLRGVTCDIHQRADASFDALEFASSGLCDVSGARDSAYLNWRYADHPTQSYRFFRMVDTVSGALRGFVVFREEEDKVFLLDAVWDGPPEGGEALILAFAKRMHEEGKVSVCIYYAGTSSVVEILPKLLFFRRAGERNLIAYVPKQRDESFRKRVLSETSWAMYDGELDI